MQPTKLVTNMAVLLGANALVLTVIWLATQVIRAIALVLR